MDFANIGDAISQATGATPQNHNQGSQDEPLHVYISGLPNSAPGAQKTAFDPTKSYGTPAKLLDNLQQTESSGNPYAVNPNTQAMGAYQFMPSTVAMLRKQGIKFDPFDANQSRAAADYYIQQLVAQNGGDYSKAMAQYGGFKTKDASKYVGSVLNGVNVSSPQTQTQQAPNASIYNPKQFIDADAITNALTGPDNSSQNAPTIQQAQVAPGNPLMQQLGRIKQAAVDFANQPLAEEVNSVVQSIPEAASNFATGVGSAAVGGYKGLYDLATGQGLDKASQDIQNIQQKYTYQPKTAGGQLLSEIPSLPISASQAALSPTLGAAGGAIGGDKWRAAGESLGNFLPAAAATLMMGRGALNAVRGSPLSAIANANNIRVEPTLNDVASTTAGENIAPQQAANVPSNQPAFQSVGAAATRNPDLGPSLKPQLAAKSTALNPEPITNPQEMNSRVQTLSRIQGLDTVRNSAIAGDSAQAATDYQLGKYDEPAGVASKAQFANEKNALENHAESIIGDTKTPIGNDLDTRIDRGRTIMDALDGIRQNLDNQWKGLYAQADAESAANGSKIAPTNTLNYVGGDKADFLGTVEGEALLKGVNARMKSLGFVDKDGNPQPITVKQAEQLKQYLNNQWQPRTNFLIRGLKDSIDEDVTSSGSPDIYSAARQLRAQKAAIFDNPEGISKLMDSDGPNGINRRVNLEDVGNTIANMSNDQMNHVVSVLRAAPDEVQPLAQDALKNIQAQFVSKMIDAGTKTAGGKPLETWNAAGVNQFINQNNAKLLSVFNDGQISKIADLRDAGNILSVNPSYPGSSAQAANALKMGAMAHLTRLGITGTGMGIGTYLNAPVTGAYVANVLGEKLANKVNQVSALSRFQKGTTKLSDMVH